MLSYPTSDQNAQYQICILHLYNVKIWYLQHNLTFLNKVCLYSAIHSNVILLQYLILLLRGFDCKGCTSRNVRSNQAKLKLT